MAKFEEVSIELKPSSFASCTIGGVVAEVHVVGVIGDVVRLQLRSPKKFGALRVLQELPGLCPAASSSPARPAIAKTDDEASRPPKRAAGGAL